MSAQDARRWIGGFEAAAAADRRSKATTRLSATQAFELALPLIAAARRALAANLRLQAMRDREDDAVRSVWARLRRHLRP